MEDSGGNSIATFGKAPAIVVNICFWAREVAKIQAHEIRHLRDTLKMGYWAGL
jgi:hypothetical protein